MNRRQPVTCFGKAAGGQFLNPGSAAAALLIHINRRAKAGSAIGLPALAHKLHTNGLTAGTPIPDVPSGLFSN